jgi:hypothetical protein
MKQVIALLGMLWASGAGVADEAGGLAGNRYHTPHFSRKG